MRCHATQLLSRWIVLAALPAGLLLAGSAAAQQQGPPLPNPRVLMLMPSGGKAGSTVEVTLMGQDLEEPQAVLTSHAGIKAEIIPEPPAPPPDPKKPAPPKPPNAPMTVRCKLTIPADTPVGTYDVRLANKWGASNPRAFVVGDLPEVLEKEPNNDVNEAQRVALNTTVSGGIAAPTDVDYYVFAGKKGQKVVVSCLASSIDSRLPAALQLYGNGGALLAFNRDYQGTDAVVDCTLPDDGDYYVRVFSFAYTQGGPDFFYRLGISTAPWIDAVFPAVVEPGKQATLTVYGRNLPGGKLDDEAVQDGRSLEKVTVTVDVPKEPEALHRLAFRGFVPPRSTGLDGFEYRIRNEDGTSNPFLLTFAQAPVVLDNGENETAETAQEVAAPCEIAGRIEKKRDRDWYIFTAKKGDTYSIEAFGDRLGSPLDLYMVVRNAENKQVLADLDDNPDVLQPVQFLTRTEDPPRFRFTAPADGKYQVMVASREAYVQAGPRYYYRLRIAPEQPDFRLVLMPQALNTPDGCVVHRGGHEYYMAYVWRLDGFAGDVKLTVEGLPDGVTCPAQTIGRDVRQGTLVVEAAADVKPWTGTIRVKGTAVINGQTVEREARAASVTWPTPQGVPTVSRLDRDLVLAVRDQEPAYVLTAGLDKAAVLGGEKITVPITVKRLWPDLKAPLQVTVLNLPPNVQPPQPLTLAKDEGSLVLNVNANVAPGTYSLVLRGQVTTPYSKDPANKQKQNVTIVQPSGPILLTVLPKQVATVTVVPGNPNVKAGGQTEVTVKVSRMYDFAGEFQVELVLPQGTKGIGAEDVTIPAGKDEAKLVIMADADAVAGSRGNLTVRATARVSDKVSATQEAKLTVNVMK
jgi:hypothetical protein